MSNDLRDCAIYMQVSHRAHDVESRNLLSLCHKISQYQKVSDLVLYNLNCDDAEKTDCFKVSNHCKSIIVEICNIPSQVLAHLQQQFYHCHELQILSFRLTRIENSTFLNNLEQMTSLTHLDLGKTGMDSEGCEKVCKQLKYLKHVDLSNCPLGSYGMHLVEAIDSWGLHPPLEYLTLTDCAMPKEVCGQLLSKLSKCEHVRFIGLGGNVLTGCLPNFLPELHQGLRELERLSMGKAQIKTEDLRHLTELIQQTKLPRLYYIILQNNSLCAMENELEEFVTACVKMHCSSKGFNIDLYIMLNENKLSWQTCKRLRQLCTGKNILLCFS